MWRRAYLFILLIRIYFALSPSYVHPDEHFQSLEPFAGMFRLHFADDGYLPNVRRATIEI